MRRHETSVAEIERSLRLLPWWWVLRWAWLGEAIWVIYLIDTRGLTIGQALIFDAVFTAAAVVAEVPTGVLADRYGLRRSMLWGSLVTAVAFVAFGLADTIALLLGSYLLFGLGFALMSGADDAYLFNSLRAAGRGAEFSRVAGRLNAVATIAAAGFTVVGGLMVIVTPLSWPIVASGGLSFAAAVFAWRLPEPPRGESDRSFLASGLSAGRRVVGTPSLRWGDRARLDHDGRGDARLHHFSADSRRRVRAAGVGPRLGSGGDHARLLRGGLVGGRGPAAARARPHAAHPAAAGGGLAARRRDRPAGVPARVRARAVRLERAAPAADRLPLAPRAGLRAGDRPLLQHPRRAARHDRRDRHARRPRGPDRAARRARRQRRRAVPHRGDRVPAVAARRRPGDRAARGGSGRVSLRGGTSAATLRACAEAPRPWRQGSVLATDDEVEAAALQFVRKISGYRTPSQANAEVFDAAVDEVAAATSRLLASLRVGAGAPAGR